MQDKNRLEALKTNYERNMAALRRRYPGLAQSVETAPDTGRYRLQPTDKENIFNLYDNEKGMFYYDENENLYSVKRELEGLGLKNTRLALFLGFGLGYEAIYYIQALANPQRTEHIFIVERDIELFCMAMYSTDITCIIENKTIDLCIGMDKNELFIKFDECLRDTKHLKYIKAMNPVYYSSGFALNKEYYLQAIRIFGEASMRACYLVGNCPEDSLIGIKHMFDNIDYIAENPGINLLYDKFKNKPAVVVSSGPSLEKNVHLLKEIADKAVVLCAESAHDILIRKGIKANIVCSLERPERRNYYWNELDEEDVKDVFHAGCPVVPRKLYESHKGKYLMVYRAFDHFKWLEIDKGMLNIAQSSGNMAFSIAVSLGCSPIILIGQDLAFGEGEKTHSGGHIDGGSDETYYNDGIIEVKANDGGTIMSTSTWQRVLKSFEVELSNYEGNCINCTEGGAYINGTSVMAFQDAIDKYLNEDIYPLDVINKGIESFTKENVKEDIAFLIPKTDSAIVDIDKVSQYCHNGVEALEKHKDELEIYSNKSSFTDEEKKRINEIYEEVMDIKSDTQSFSEVFQLLIMHVVQPYYIKFEIDINELPSQYDCYETALAHIILRQRDWFAIINNLSLLVREELEKAKVKLQDIIKKYE